MPKVFLKVRAVDGHMITDPRTIGGTENRRIGYERVIEGTVVAAGVQRPRVRHVFVGGEFEVPETTDLYLRKSIEDGSLEYVETIHETTKGNATTRNTFREVDLVRATVKHQKLRVAAMKAEQDRHAAAAAADEEALAELDLEAEEATAATAPAPTAPAT